MRGKGSGWRWAGGRSLGRESQQAGRVAATLVVSYVSLLIILPPLSVSGGVSRQEESPGSQQAGGVALCESATRDSSGFRVQGVGCSAGCRV